MDIREITDNKKKYIDLLLLADESEAMIDTLNEVKCLFWMTMA